ncbi:MAG: prolyl oligopeptidase family serine peptidase [Nannocystaceae bacterium]|nr:prolyl oligopeptidase family serine peptidase [Nannocystaceae bacterium]
MVVRRRIGIGGLCLALACAARSDGAPPQDCPPAPAAVASTPTPVAAPRVAAPEPSGFRSPAEAVRALVLAPPSPQAWVSPTGDAILLGHAQAMPPLAEVARPFAGLAGLRIDEQRGSERHLRSFDRLSILDLDGNERVVAGAPGSTLTAPSFSPDGRMLAWLDAQDDRVSLWVAARDDGAPRRLLDVVDLIAPAYRWLGSDTLIVLADDRGGPPPPRAEVPSGPTIEEAKGERAPNRTWQDLLRNPDDEVRFAHWATAQLERVELSGTRTPLGERGMVTSFEASPDGQYLLVERVRRPFSYAVPLERFARVIEVRDRSGAVVATLADDEPAEAIPIEGVRTGPRQSTWLPSAGATLLWFEALDGGDPRKAAPHRDRLMVAEAPFQAPREAARLQHRARGLDPLEDRRAVLVSEYDRDRRWSTTWLQPIDAGAAARKLFDRSVNDAYGDPGTPVRRTLPGGQRAIAVEQGAIFLAGDGATEAGDRPFLDRLVLDDGTRTRLLESPADASIEFVGFAAGALGQRLVVREQSPSEPPNLHLREGEQRRALTQWPDPSAQLRGVTRTLLKYERRDGVALSGTLWTPPGPAPASGWPLLVWAYPLEYNDKDTAGQVRAAPNRYLRVTGSSALALLAAGYAVLDDASMPVVGDPETMNDSLLAQLQWSAEAAIDAAVAHGIDRNRVAIGGHSYGAFMTANLLAHTQLFKAGIARSGAYNRTLTPFGYQSERRTLWEAPQTYVAVSPLVHADRIDEPLLLVHGELDDNPGTFPLQSQRLFQAIRGNGGVARLVVLPREAHGYAAQENVLHLLAEEIDWLDAHVRGVAR